MSCIDEKTSRCSDTIAWIVAIPVLLAWPAICLCSLIYGCQHPDAVKPYVCPCKAVVDAREDRSPVVP